MAGRLNLRPIYGRDEQTGGERIAQGIGSAIAGYEQHQQAGSADEAKRRAAGQVMTTRGEGGFDRLRSLGRRLIGRSDEPQSTPLAPPPEWSGRPQAPTSRIIPASGIVDDTTPPDAPVIQQGRSMDRAPQIQQTPNRAPLPPVGGEATPLGGAIPAGAPRNISTALKSYTEKDDYGNEWSIDPNHAQNQKLAGDRAELEMKDEFAERGTKRSIDAATSAGMPAAEANARVRTGTMRYDEQFGQRMRPSTAMTFEQRRQLSTEHDQREATIRTKLGELAATGRANGPEALQLRREALELSKERLQMQREQGDDRARAGDVGRETNIAGAISSTLTKDPIAQTMLSPEQKAAEARRAGERDTHLKNAATGQRTVHNSHATQTEARARAQALKAAGKTPDEIRAAMQAEGYRVH